MKALADTLARNHAVSPENSQAAWYATAMTKLLETVSSLSHARDLTAIGAIVRDAARDLTGADGATFILRDNDKCYYADENAISPLWKGRRFPMQSCISGWAMLNAQPVAIEDIYTDPRIPIDAYRPTFVKSLVMVPIRRDAPIGAIGNYWAAHRKPAREEIMLLQALADTTSVAIENVSLFAQLQNKIQSLEASNTELGRFAWVASHDLQEPLRTIALQLDMLAANKNIALDPSASGNLQTAQTGARRLQNLIKGLLTHARAEKVIAEESVDLNKVLAETLRDLQPAIAETEAVITAADLPQVSGHPEMLGCLLQNLIGNAIKFRRPAEKPHIAITSQPHDNAWLISIRDNGMGIDQHYLRKVFDYFQRLNTQETHPGAGLGLAICKKIVAQHGGKIWLESAPGQGTTANITLPHPLVRERA